MITMSFIRRLIDEGGDDLTSRALKELLNHANNLEERNKELQSALGFYADENNWGNQGPKHHRRKFDVVDNGLLARRALNLPSVRFGNEPVISHVPLVQENSKRLTLSSSMSASGELALLLNTDGEYELCNEQKEVLAIVVNEESAMSGHFELWRHGKVAYFGNMPEVQEYIANELKVVVHNPTYLESECRSDLIGLLGSWCRQPEVKAFQNALSRAAHSQGLPKRRILEDSELAYPAVFSAWKTITEDPDLSELHSRIVESAGAYDAALKNAAFVLGRFYDGALPEASHAARHFIAPLASILGGGTGEIPLTKNGLGATIGQQWQAVISGFDDMVMNARGEHLGPIEDARSTPELT
jgi:hypothetical protein